MSSDLLAILVVISFVLGLASMGFVPAVLTVFTLYAIACFVAPARTNRR